MKTRFVICFVTVCLNSFSCTTGGREPKYWLPIAEGDDQEGKFYSLNSDTCVPGMHRVWGSPIGLFVSCDSPSPAQAFVLYINPIEGGKIGNWKSTQRFWQEPMWSEGVRGLMWFKQGVRLIVVVSRPGEGSKVYDLNLMRRSSHLLYPVVQTGGAMENIRLLKWDSSRFALQIQEGESKPPFELFLKP